MKKKLTLLLSLLAFAAVGNAQKYVGGDISLLPSYEEHGVKYLGRGGNNNQVKPLDYFADSAHWNAMRVRLFVDPSKADDEDKNEGVRQDLDYVTKLAKRITNKGYSLMLDFHYSDTWTDPAQHSTPSAWNSSDPAVLADNVYAYTKKSLQHLKDNGVKIDFIQPGNEVTYGMMWPTGRCYPNGTNYGTGTFANFVKYLNAGIKACREIYPDAKIVLHTEMGRTWNVYTFYNTIGTQVDYDIIGLSYYPDWHGPLTTLNSLLNTLESQHADKRIMIVETGYGAKWQLGKPSYTPTLLGWPLTEAGQKQFADDLITELNKHKNVTGLYWWMPEDNEYWSDKNPVRSQWWNASLYTQDTGKPLDAMFELQRFIGKDPTGITSIKGNGVKTSGNKWYNLQGQRVSSPKEKGIYICNGRKVLVK